MLICPNKTLPAEAAVTAPQQEALELTAGKMVPWHGMSAKNHSNKVMGKGSLLRG